MDDILIHMTKIVTKTLNESGIILSKPGMLRDVIITTTGGEATLQWSDGTNSHIIAVVPPNTVFNHGFVGGWTPWRGAVLELIKTGAEGVCWISVGYVPASVQDYSVWRLE